MTAKLIVALDFAEQTRALHLVEKLDPAVCHLKVGSELFTSGGPQLVKQLVDRQFKVFLDLKWHDIPNTVAHACQAGADLGVWMMNVHAMGGLAMMQAARKVLEGYGQQRPLLIAVTVLTSWAPEDLPTIGLKSSLLEQVMQLAVLTQAAELDGVVSSPHEVQFIKDQLGADFITVTPGIRLDDRVTDDQVRVMTPKHASKTGTDYLVIGRPITQASHPEQVVIKILADIG